MSEHKTNILVVDDLPEHLLVMESVLEELDENIIAARSGAEALRQVMQHEFAVILMDVNMPDMDGYETAELIRRRKRSAHTPIIFITAYADELQAARGYTLGAVDFMLAPVVPEILRTKVRVFVDLFRMTQQVKRQAQEQVALAHEQAARAAAEQAVARLRFLAEASNRLAGSLDLNLTLRCLLDLVVPAQADLGIINLLSEDGAVAQSELAWVAIGRRSTRTLAGPEDLHASFAKVLQKVIAQGKPEFLRAEARKTSMEPSGDQSVGEQFTEAMAVQCWDGLIGSEGGTRTDGAALRSMIVLPLIARDRVLGAVSLAMGPSGREQSDTDLIYAQDLAQRAAIAIDNARLYGQVQEGDRRKNEFLAMLAHELRNPLAPLVNGIQLLRLRGPKQPEFQKIEDMMERQVQHLVRLVDDLLDVSRITRDKIQLQMEDVDVATVVSRAVEVSRPLFDSRGQTLTVTLPPEPPGVYGDPVRLAQVLSNMLNNAAKYTETGGKVWLRVDQDRDEVVFRIRDTGIGIPAPMLPRVFDLFTQVERALDRSQGGLGIGLTLVRRLVEMHGGTVQAFSEGPNLGSEFVVRLPALIRVAQKPALEVVGQPVLPHNGRRRVLIVEDNVDVAESLAILLKEDGQEVHVTYDGRTALAAAQSFRPEVVLLDIGLPEMDGYEVARRMLKQPGLAKPLLVALSGYGQEQDRRRSQEAGFDHHLVKPALLPELKALLS